jgi:hypothetical protein
MITKNTSPVKAWVKQMTLILPVSGLILLCCFKTVAQPAIADTVPKVNTTYQAPSSTEGASDEMLAEYLALEKKVEADRKQGQFVVSETDRSRMETIFVSMTKEQQSKQWIGFMKRPGPLPKSVPTTKQLDAWKNGKMYGLWINEKRVSNGVLNQYTITDFSNVFVSKLGKNTVNYGKHYYQVDLMTNEYYEKYRRETLEEIKEHPLMMTIRWRKPGK